jgi:hypothetical protein
MTQGRYLQSKRITPRREVNYHFINLCKHPQTREYLIFMSEEERPKTLDREKICIFPGKTRNAKLAQKLFEEIGSVGDFIKKAQEI